MAERNPAWLVVSALCALTLAGCAAELARGNAQPADGVAGGHSAEPSPSGDQHRTEAAPPEPTDASLAGVRPCELLGPTDRSTAGLTSLGKEKTVGSAPACDWTEPGVFGLLVTLDDANGLDGAEPGAERVRLGGHDALRIPGADDGTCAVVLGVGEAASVHIDVSNSNFAETDRACRRATKVAELIGPKIKAGGR